MWTIETHHQHQSGVSYRAAVQYIRANKPEYIAHAMMKLSS